MQENKFNGVIAEIAKSYPNIDLAEFLSQKLDLPIDKAEILAERIKKKFFQQNQPAQQVVKMLVEKNTAELITEKETYLIEYLSKYEFNYFIKWLLEELEFEVLQERNVTDFGVDFIAIKNGEKIVILARKYPSKYNITDSITMIAQKAKQMYECNRVIVVTTTFFTLQAVTDAQKLGIELWDTDTLVNKIVEAKKKLNVIKQMQFPHFQGSLLQSLQSLEETKLFTIKPRANEKYDLFVPWIKYPLLTYQANSNKVIRCLYRIKYNNPVTEKEAETLISVDQNGNQTGPNDEQVYLKIAQYLQQFLE